MGFFDIILGNLRGSGFVYLVCIAAIIGAFKYLGDHPHPRRFTLMGAGLILIAGIGGGIVQSMLYRLMVGSPTAVDFSNPDSMRSHTSAIATWGTISSVLSFVTGAAYAVGMGCIVYAVFVDKAEGEVQKRTKKRKSRPQVEDEEYDRPNRRKRQSNDVD